MPFWVVIDKNITLFIINKKMKNFKLWNVLLGWLVFAIAATTYLLTMEPTASFWDCGEFIASAYKLDVGHPPGAPFFMLMGRFFSLFASDPSQVAMCVNAVSALASAFTILFLFWTITALARKLVQPDTLAKGIALLGAGAVGALAYTFSDTFWFSAVEGEVYASSSLFTAVVFWLILKWDEHADEEGSDKWLILIAYLMGLSIGVHLLNLLTIPAIVLVYYFRRHEFSWKGVTLAFLASVCVLAVILYGIIPGVPTIAGWFELLFVNSFGMPFNTGLLVYLVLMAAALVWAILESYKAIETKQPLSRRTIISFVLAMALAGVPFIKESATIGILLIAVMVLLLFWKKDVISARWLNTISMMVTVVIVGYMSYGVIVIRSNADTPMDQNSPDNVFSLKYYLNREQYGDTPLLYGQTYNAPVKMEIEKQNGELVCVPVEKEAAAKYAPAPGTIDKYVEIDSRPGYEYMDEFKMFFPRMHSSQAHHVNAYKEWADIKGKKIRYDYCGQQRVDFCPTFGENLRFFFRYQVNFMYWRYFMWNFAGRQNDLQSFGEIHKGNWLTGIPFIDNALLGDQSKLPTELRENKGHNVYFMLPLLLGIIGLLWQLSKSNNTDTKKEGVRSFTITFLLFFLTGLAIVIYLNQTPYQPRERDYAYAGSFYAFCIWIGLGVMGVIQMINALIKSKKWQTVVASVLVLICLGVPAQMASQNWDDHDRSDRYVARDFGANYLNSCEENAIIFCNGDNDTFPLWYNIEVEGERTDVRACNLSYLQTDWYIDQMKRPYYESPALPISWEYKDYMEGKNDMVPVVDRKNGKPLAVDQAFKFLHSNEESTKIEGEDYIPAAQLYIPSPVDTLFLKKASYFNRSEMMVMEMLSTNKWKRPMYFAATVGNDFHLGLDPYLELTGLAYRITDTRSPDGHPRVNTEVMYDNMMNKFKFGNVNKPGIYLDENTMRMCHTHRSMFVRLAEALCQEGNEAEFWYNENYEIEDSLAMIDKYEKALKVLDYAEEVLPAYNIPYDNYSIGMAELYCQLGKPDKGLPIFDALANRSVEYIRWIKSLDAKQRNKTRDTFDEHIRIFDHVLRRLNYYDKDKAMFNKYFDIYQSLGLNK
jgi:hypothetical protein